MCIPYYRMHLFVYANGDGKEGIMNRDAIYRIELHLTARIGEGEQRSVRSRRGASGRRVEKVEQTFTRVLEALPKATFARRACRGFTVDDPQVETWSDTPPPPPPLPSRNQQSREAGDEARWFRSPRERYSLSRKFPR